MTVIPKPSSPNSQAKVPRVLLVQARSSPPGVVEKSSSPGGLAVFSLENLACPEHDLLSLRLWELRPHKPD